MNLSSVSDGRFSEASFHEAQSERASASGQPILGNGLVCLGEFQTTVPNDMKGRFKFIHSNSQVFVLTVSRNADVLDSK